jgi:FixJ family two-component response regulator
MIFAPSANREINHKAIMKNKTVFIVDSDSSSAQKLRTHLETLHFEVTHFTTGAEMMNHLPSNPCLIILAHDLAENNTGLDYLRLIKTMNRNIPVLFLMSQHNLSMSVQALRLGAAFYLEKLNTSFESIKNVLYDLDIEKKRKYSSALRNFRQGVFSLYGIY